MPLFVRVWAILFEIARQLEASMLPCRDRQEKAGLLVRFAVRILVHLQGPQLSHHGLDLPNGRAEEARLLFGAELMPLWRWPAAEMALRVVDLRMATVAFEGPFTLRLDAQVCWREFAVAKPAFHSD